MRVIITGRRYNVSKGLKKVIEEKLSKIKFFYDQVLSFHVIIEKEKLSYKAEITFNANGKKFYMQEVAPSVHEAIDTLADKLERQVRKHKDRMQNHKHSKKDLHEASSVPSDRIIFSNLNKKPKTELEAMQQLAISEEEYLPFFEENDQGTLEAAIAVRLEDGLFDVYVHDSQCDKWLEKKVYLENENIAKTEMQDFTLLICSVQEAIVKLSISDVPVIVFENKDDHTVQALATTGGNEYELFVLGS